MGFGDNAQIGFFIDDYDNFVYNNNTKTFARKRSLPNVNVYEIRSALNMTQKAFADILGVSRRTVEAWESGKSTPTPTAKKLMHLIQEDHSLIL